MPPRAFFTLGAGGAGIDGFRVDRAREQCIDHVRARPFFLFFFRFKFEFVRFDRTCEVGCDIAKGALKQKELWEDGIVEGDFSASGIGGGECVCADCAGGFW